ncbi:MAG: YceI family protein [Leadbetterella sp.]|nr:YceI family protein [Leadbetterella sp.]
MKKVTILALAALIGTASCTNSNSDTAETSDAEAVASLEGEAYAVSLNESVVEWKAFHKGGFAPRWGTLKLSAGEFSVKGGEINAGSFTIDMNSLIVDPASVTEKDKKAIDLQNHLKSADFFDVANHATAKFEITGVTDFDATKHTSVIEGANKVVSGNLTLQGNTVNVTFPAKIVVADGTAKVDARFTVDRTAWNLKFGVTEADPAEWGISKDFEIGINLTAVAK